MTYQEPPKIAERYKGRADTIEEIRRHWQAWLELRQKSIGPSLYAERGTE